MRRIILATAGVAVVAFVAATIGSAKPLATTGAAGAEAKAPVLPKLPAEIADRKRLIVGVKCDTPPFGFIDVRGKNAGVDVDIAKQFARYAFGRAQRLTFVCAPTAAREPLLTTNRVDLVISTFTYTADRDTRIDFSRAYFNSTGRLLVKNDSAIQRLADIRGKRVATTSGSIYDRWMKRCFTDTQVIVLDSVTNAVIAFNQGRADAVMFDDTSLALIAATDRSSKMTDDLFLEQPYGIGIKQGNAALKRWVDARLNLMKRKDLFAPIIRSYIAPRFVPAFLRNTLRPTQDFTYRSPSLPSLDTVCP
ncbi:MAG TPA: transporter substrate-binding domain-containing protein [Gaiella sp.]|uniref:transporter substrate-binding domain-containing protein n=1 Tax=Gaiella sp. TaxID=2663207 RepID=UPI002D804F6E|nr:transporter substrate-binding domain-containing protein [Gaiella sp.]HET9287155.1 transporter substrate-binding domain-containing protein [Gaiella sp.]